MFESLMGCRSRIWCYFIRDFSCLCAELVTMGLVLMCLFFFGIVQVRIQLGQGSAAQVTKTMLKEEGFGAFYKVYI